LIRVVSSVAGLFRSTPKLVWVTIKALWLLTE
jgi:hypothetical protein